MGCHLFNTYCHCYTHNGRTFGQDKNAVGENDFTLLRSFHNVFAGDSICYSTAQGCIENSTLKEMMRRSQLPVGGDSQRPEYHWESAPVSATRDHRSPEGSCSKSRRSDACSAKTCSEREKNTQICETVWMQPKIWTMFWGWDYLVCEWTRMRCW